MAAPGVAQPDAMPFLKFRLDDVEVKETDGWAPSTILNDGKDFQFTVKLGVEGNLAALLIGDKYKIEHHCQQLDGPGQETLDGGNFTVPDPPDPVEESSGPYTAGADLPVGTWVITTLVGFNQQPIASIVTAFQTMVLRVQT
jgi:hypothetical protein